ncbi:MAG: alpha/beta hydrolase [Actinobacteria bacterium]|nr:alpha/beta hydrolase [Actinomycetota bacterium]
MGPVPSGVPLDYPLAPARPHPHMLRSLLGALAWIEREHPQPAGVHLLGDSAGGNLAMMLAILSTNPDVFSRYDRRRTYLGPPIASVASLYGILDRHTWVEDGFPDARVLLEAYAGPSATSLAVTEENAITPMDIDRIERLPPTFLGAGTRDALARSSRVAAARFQAAFPHVEHKTYPGARHGFFGGGRGSRQLRADVAAFLLRHDPFA